MLISLTGFFLLLFLSIAFGVLIARTAAHLLRWDGAGVDILTTAGGIVTPIIACSFWHWALFDASRAGTYLLKTFPVALVSALAGTLSVVVLGFAFLGLLWAFSFIDRHVGSHSHDENDGP